MGWQQRLEVEKENLLKDLIELIQINSVLDEETANDNQPFGEGPKKALEWLLAKGETDGFISKNVANVAGHLEMGQGEELLGILGHVDVVPATGNWTHAPFQGEIADGKLFGRGAIDDKGPTMAAYYAMKLVKNAGIPFTKRVRLIIGTDEESGFRCVSRYFETEEQPTIAFAPDADFPIINSEKGISTIRFATAVEDSELVNFTAGKRTNMVPDVATATITTIDENIHEAITTFASQHGVTASIDGTTIEMTGISAHAMEPNDGKNAAVLLATFLKNYINSPFLTFLSQSFYEDTRGKNLALDYSDEASGETTLNPGVIRYDQQDGGKIDVSLRYSVSYPFEEKIASFKHDKATLTIVSNSLPHYVPADDPFIQTLQKVYERNTGEEAKLLSIGGGTYARVLEKGVAFGMLFPGEPDIAHQVDEFVIVENLYRAVVIYADAIAEIATK